MDQLTGKRIVITGASAGIGAELARRLGARGCHLVLGARRLDRLEQVAREAQARGSAAGHTVRAVAVPCDVTLRDQVLALAATAREAFGGIDVWVNNAGQGMRHALLDATEEDLLALFRLNALSALWGYQAVVPAWLAQGQLGHIIDICSLGGKSGYALSGGYSAAKHALSALGDTLRQELIGSGINVTTVYPGPTVSDFGKALTDHTAGAQVQRAERILKSPNPLVRRISASQPTAVVVNAIIRCIEHPRPTVYPHRWGNLAVPLNNLLPGLMLKMLKRAGGAQ